MYEVSVGRRFAKIDDADFDLVMRYKWSVLKTPTGKIYAQAKYKIGDKLHGILMHRLIMAVPTHDSRQVDHVDCDGLNNQRENLRILTNQQNKMNRRSFRGKSKYKGVCFDKAVNKWKASIGFNGKSINIGRFLTEEEAALAYDKKAQELFGEYALTNETMLGKKINGKKTKKTKKTDA